MLNNLAESTVEPLKRPPLWEYRITKDGIWIDQSTPFLQILCVALVFSLIYGGALAVAMIPWRYAIGTIAGVALFAMLVGFVWRVYSAISFRNRIFGFIYSIERKTHPAIASIERAKNPTPIFITIVDSYRRLFDEAMAYTAQNRASLKVSREASRVLFNSFLQCMHRIQEGPRGVEDLGRVGNETQREHIDRLLFVIQWASEHLPKAEADKFISPIAFFINDMSYANNIPLVRVKKSIVNSWVLTEDCIASQYYSTTIFDEQFQIPTFQAIFGVYLSKEDVEGIERIGRDWSEKDTEPGFCRKRNRLPYLMSGPSTKTLQNA